MSALNSFAYLLAVLLASTAALAQAPYYPDKTWQHKTPAEAGLDAARVKEAVDFAIAAESRNPRDLVLNHYRTFGASRSATPSARSATAAT
jgi:hypothetical protein